MSVPLNNVSIQENVIEYEQISTPQYYDLNIDLEGELKKILQSTFSSFPKEGTELELTQERELINHHEENSKVEHPIFESIKDLFEEKFHNHCFFGGISVAL